MLSVNDAYKNIYLFYVTGNKLLMFNCLDQMKAEKLAN